MLHELQTIQFDKTLQCLLLFLNQMYYAYEIKNKNMKTYIASLCTIMVMQNPSNHTPHSSHLLKVWPPAPDSVPVPQHYSFLWDQTP